MLTVIKDRFVLTMTNEEAAEFADIAMVAYVSIGKRQEKIVAEMQAHAPGSPEFLSTKRTLDKLTRQKSMAWELYAQLGKGRK